MFTEQKINIRRKNEVWGWLAEERPGEKKTCNEVIKRGMKEWKVSNERAEDRKMCWNHT